MDSTASYKFIQTFCKTLTQHQRELLFVLTLWCYIHWLAGSEKGPEPSLDRGPSPWPSACRRAPTEDVFPLLKPQAAYCSDTISHVSLRWASPWRQMANRRGSTTRLNRVSQDQRGRRVHMLPNTFKRNNQHFNSTHPTHTHILFLSAFHASLSSTHFCSTSLANHLDFQGHFSSSWPRCYGNFQPPPPPSPWKQDKKKWDAHPAHITHLHAGRIAFDLAFRLRRPLIHEKGKKCNKSNAGSLTCSSLDRTTLLVSIGLGLKPLAWKHM